MKIKLDIKDPLLAEAKAAAVQQRTSLKRLIEEGLLLRLHAQAAGGRSPTRLQVLHGRGGLVSGLDATSNKAMLAAMGDDA